MEKLSIGERNLVSLAAALASNSVGCVEHYVSETRNAGYTDRQVEEAVNLANRVRRTPAQRVFGAAIGLVSRAVVTGAEGAAPGPDETKTDQRREAAADAKTDGADTASQSSGALGRRCC